MIDDHLIPEIGATSTGASPVVEYSESAYYVLTDEKEIRLAKSKEDYDINMRANGIVATYKLSDFVSIITTFMGQDRGTLGNPRFFGSKAVGMDKEFKRQYETYQAVAGHIRLIDQVEKELNIQ